MSLELEYMDIQNKLVALSFIEQQENNASISKEKENTLERLEILLNNIENEDIFDLVVENIIELISHYPNIKNNLNNSNNEVIQHILNETKNIKIENKNINPFIENVEVIKERLDNISFIEKNSIIFHEKESFLDYIKNNIKNLSEHNIEKIKNLINSDSLDLFLSNELNKNSEIFKFINTWYEKNLNVLIKNKASLLEIKEINLDSFDSKFSNQETRTINQANRKEKKSNEKQFNIKYFSNDEKSSKEAFKILYNYQVLSKQNCSYINMETIRKLNIPIQNKSFEHFNIINMSNIIKIQTDKHKESLKLMLNIENKTFENKKLELHSTIEKIKTKIKA